VAATERRRRRGCGIREALGAACALIGASGPAAAVTEVETALLYYGEPDRVQTLEGVVAARREVFDRGFLSFRFTYDTLTGASANGATPSLGVQIFTRPSGIGFYTVPAGETPLDDTFKDTRIMATGDLDFAIGDLNRGGIGFNYSSEYDYSSLSLSGRLSRDFERRNRTLSAGFSVSQDKIDPEGGIPAPFGAMAPAGTAQPRLGGSDDKDVADLLLGFTQVIDQVTLLHLNYSHSHLSGYQTHPFKLLSVVQGPGDANPGETVDYIYEKRPDSRTKQSVYGEIKRRFGDATIVDLSYRYLWDDWGIGSHTVDFHYRHRLGNKSFLQPHLRYYKQTAADFYAHSLIDGQSLPAFASADYRLGEMTAYTIGLKYGRSLDNGHAFSLRVEYYLQQGDSSPPDAVGVLRDLDLFPSVDALIIQVGYSLDLEWL
jgi:hypothetical protein